MSNSHNVKQTNAPEEEKQSTSSSDDVADAVQSELAESAAEGDIDSVRQNLAKKTEETLTLQDKYLRQAAEFENFKKRLQRDQADAIRFANERLIKDILPTLDNLERAIHTGEEQSVSDALLEGIKLTQKQFYETLTKLGLQRVSSVGEPFDPSKHQAVAQIESDTAEPDTVIEEFQKGYFLHERILRPAMVTVAKHQSNHETSTNSE